jgi:hypothetical protein
MFSNLFSYKATRWCIHQIIDKQINIRLGACTQADIYLIRYRSSRPCRRVFLAEGRFPLHREKEKNELNN